MSFDVNYVNLNTAVSHFNADKLKIAIKRSDGLEAEFVLPTDYLETLLEHLTIVLNSVGYTYVSGLTALKQGEENEQ